MMEREQNKKLISLVPLLLFAVLAASVLTVLLSGTKIYAKVTRENSSSYLKRTSVQYVYTRIMQAEDKGSVRIENFGGTPAVVIDTELDGESFTLRFYCRGGCLCELFTYDENEVAPEDGEMILKMQSMEAEITDGLLRVTFTHESGEKETLFADLTPAAYDGNSVTADSEKGEHE